MHPSFSASTFFTNTPIKALQLLISSQFPHRRQYIKMVREEKNSVPEWVGILLGEKFFTPCSLHHSAKKNDKTFFCLCCRAAICFSCFSSHRTHSLLQIRRYVYHEVIRLGDAEKLLNCSLVQPYTTNRAKVVFLKHRPKTRPFRGSGNLCITCFRTLQCPYLFCSVSCKINHQGTEKIKINQQHESYGRHPPRNRAQTIQTLPDLKTGGVPVVTSTAAAKLVKKKRSCVRSLAAVLCRPRCFPVADVATAVNRRKGAPQRSPLS